MPGPLERTRGLLRRDPLAGGALAFALLVLAGLPPGVIGLVAKVVALRPAVGAELWPLALVAVVAVVLGIAVYLRWFALLLAGPRAGRPQVEEEPPAATQEPTRAAGIRQRAGTATRGARRPRPRDRRARAPQRAAGAAPRPAVLTERTAPRAALEETCTSTTTA